MEVARRNVQVPKQTCRSKRKGARCPALEPVLEHYEAPSEKVSCPSNGDGAQTGNNRKGNSGMRILLKLRDGYVKVMNDVASGADYGGVSSFYGCPAVADYSALRAKLQREA